MGLTDIPEAQANLAKLVERAIRGEDVVLARDGTPLVRLVPVNEPLAPRVGGQWKGRVRIADDFDELPTDIAEAFGTTPE